MKVLGKRLKKAREDAGYKQIDAAKKLGISNGTLSGYERNYRDPDTDILNDMAVLYDVSIDWLLGKTDESKKNELHITEDEELEGFIKNVRAWHYNAPNSNDEKLKLLEDFFNMIKKN